MSRLYLPPLCLWKGELNMENLELETAIQQLTGALAPSTAVFATGLMESLGHHLAEDLYAPIPVPGFNRSAMDGYALRAADTAHVPVRLKVAGEIPAGSSQTFSGQAVRIMTGARIPDGFDAVIRQEDTDYGEDVVEIRARVKPFDNYVPIGEDIKQGELVIKKGTRLGAVHLGILASLGIQEVQVLRPMKVGILSTGSELALPGMPLAPGQIYASNGLVLAGRLQELGCQVVFNEMAADETEAIAGTIRGRIHEVDVLITTGGVSVGKKDLMPEVTHSLEASRLFWKVRMRPGTPALASLYEGRMMLSLSGNPYAALATFELLFRPLLDRFYGTSDYSCRRTLAVLEEDFPKASRQRRFVRAFCQDGKAYLNKKGHESSVLSTMAGQNGFIDLPAGTPPLEKGQPVAVVLL